MRFEPDLTLVFFFISTPMLARTVSVSLKLELVLAPRSVASPAPQSPKKGTGNKNACCSYRLHVPYQDRYCVK